MRLHRHRSSALHLFPKCAGSGHPALVLRRRVHLALRQGGGGGESGGERKEERWEAGTNPISHPVSPPSSPPLAHRARGLSDCELARGVLLESAVDQLSKPVRPDSTLQAPAGLASSVPTSLLAPLEAPLEATNQLCRVERGGLRGDEGVIRGRWRVAVVVRAVTPRRVLGAARGARANTHALSNGIEKRICCGECGVVEDLRVTMSGCSASV